MIKEKKIMIHIFSILGSTNENKSFTWTQNACNLLINNRSDLDQDFNSGQKHVHIWKKIAERLNKNGIQVSAQECNDKWRNMMQTFRKNVQKANTSGEESVNWPYFTIMYELFGKKDSVNPPKRNLCQSSLGLETTLEGIASSSSQVPKINNISDTLLSDDDCDDKHLKHKTSHSEKIKHANAISVGKKRNKQPLEKMLELVTEENEARKKMDSTLTTFLESMLDIEKQKLALKKIKYSDTKDKLN